MAKVKCISNSLKGAKNISSVGVCTFDSDGFSDVSDDLAAHLVACKVVTVVETAPAPAPVAEVVEEKKVVDVKKFDPKSVVKK